MAFIKASHAVNSDTAKLSELGLISAEELDEHRLVFPGDQQYQQTIQERLGGRSKIEGAALDQIVRMGHRHEESHDLFTVTHGEQVGAVEYGLAHCFFVLEAGEVYFESHPYENYGMFGEEKIDGTIHVMSDRQRELLDMVLPNFAEIG